MASQHQRRQTTRRHLVEAAGLLFDERGFEDTTIDQIVAAADVAKGTFYQHFDGKVAILFAVMRERQAEHNAVWQPGSDPRSDLERYLRALCAWFEAHSTIARPFLLEGLKAAQPQGSEVPPQGGTRDTVARLLAAAQAQGQARRDLPAESLASFLVGLVVQAILQDPTPPIWDRVEAAIRLFWEGAGCS